jgi:hypothetical protein
MGWFSAARTQTNNLLDRGQFSDCRSWNQPATADLDRPEAAGPDRSVNAGPADSREYGCPIDREQLLGTGVIAGGFGADRGQDRRGQCIGGGSDGGFGIGGHDRPASGHAPSSRNSLSSIPLRTKPSMIGAAFRVRANCDNFSNRLPIHRPPEVAPPVADAAVAFRKSSRSLLLTLRKTGRARQGILRTIVRTKFDASVPEVEAAPVCVSVTVSA